VNRLSKTLDENQTVEQAGFRQGFSTMDHLQAINQLIEKTSEFQMPLYLTFVDYEKAFDNLEHVFLWKSLKDQGIEDKYINILKHIYGNATASIKLDKESEKFEIQKGVRQGDTISPKLFTAALENIFRNLNWDDKGININGRMLSHLRFADDVVLISQNAEELEQMLKDLECESKKAGLKINIDKTKMMTNKFAVTRRMKISQEQIEIVDHYKYLGQTININRDPRIEINCRIKAAWGSFIKHNLILTSNLPLCLKKKIMDTCILPALTYGSETWTLTKDLENKLKITERNMERRILGIKLIDKVRNSTIREKTKIIDVIKRTKESKWSWAGHIARRMDDRWSKALTDWQVYQGKRQRGRPKTRWMDEIIKYAGRQWMTKAQNRLEWRNIGEAFVQQWTENG
jgi:Reverse transcriptase (RNA-dependent DNA polymerase)